MTLQKNVYNRTLLIGVLMGVLGGFWGNLVFSVFDHGIQGNPLIPLIITCSIATVIFWGPVFYFMKNPIYEDNFSPDEKIKKMPPKLIINENYERQMLEELRKGNITWKNLPNNLKKAFSKDNFDTYVKSLGVKPSLLPQKAVETLKELDESDARKKNLKIQEKILGETNKNRWIQYGIFAVMLITAIVTYWSSSDAVRLSYAHLSVYIPGCDDALYAYGGNAYANATGDRSFGLTASNYGKHPASLILQYKIKGSGAVPMISKGDETLTLITGGSFGVVKGFSFNYTSGAENFTVQMGLTCSSVDNTPCDFWTFCGLSCTYNKTKSYENIYSSRWDLTDSHGLIWNVSSGSCINLMG